MLMTSLGVLAVAMALLMVWSVNHFDLSGLPPDVARQMEQQITQLEQQTGVAFRTMGLVIAALILAAGAVFGGLGVLVRTGGIGWVMAGMIATGALILVVGLALLTQVIQGILTGAVGPAFGGAFLLAVPFVLMVIVMVGLIQLARGTSHAAMHRQRAAIEEGERPGPPPQARSGGPSSGGLGYGVPPTSPPPQSPPGREDRDGTPPQG